MALSARSASSPKSGGGRKAEYEIPSDPAELAGWLNAKLDKSKNRLPERQMKLNLAFTLGEQWLVWDQDKRQFTKPRQRTDDPNAPVRITVNKVGGIVEQFISRLLKHDPESEVLPVSDEPDDVDAARVGRRILQSELNRLRWRSLLVDLQFWVVPLGWSFFQIAWDPHAGAYMGASDDGGAVHEGEITVEVVPAFELIVDPNARKRDLSDARWAIRTITMTKEAAWEHYGQVVAPTEESRALSDEVYDLMQWSEHRSAKGDNVKVHQFWLRPGSRAAPQGMVVTWSGATILEPPVPFPYKHGRLPYIQFDTLPGIGQREGRTFVKDLVPLQADYNDARSREAAIRRTLVPKILAPAGSIDPRRIGSRVEVITYNPTGTPPKMEIPNASWTQQYEQSMTRSVAEMEKRSSTETMAFGTRTSAAAIMAMQDMQELEMSVPTKLLAESIEHVGQMVLSLVRQFWHEDRVVRTWSQDGELEIEHFSSADIARELDVRVSTESGMPDSKAGRVQLATELQQMGMIPDPRAFVRILDMPGMDLISETLDLDTKQQKRETNKLIMGTGIPINAWDNHVIHYATINDFRKTRDYEDLPPEIKAVVDAHADAHNEQIIAAQQAAMGVGMNAPGTPPGAPGGGPPAGPGGPPGPGGQGEPQAVPHEGGPATPQREQAIRARAGVGGPAQPGAVPGVTADRQAASMGR